MSPREFDQASLSRLAFWTDALGEQEIAAITQDDIDAAPVRLAERGRLNAGEQPTPGAANPFACSTVNRYLRQAGSVFKHARRLRLVPRTFVAPTRGIERAPERADPERYWCGPLKRPNGDPTHAQVRLPYPEANCPPGYSQPGAAFMLEHSGYPCARLAMYLRATHDLASAQRKSPDRPSGRGRASDGCMAWRVKKAKPLQRAGDGL